MIGLDRIFKLITEKQPPLIENLSDRELNNPEGAGIDLRAGIVSKLLESKSFLGINQRSTLKSEKILQFEEGKLCSYILKPKEYILVTTIESLNMTSDLVGIIRPRGTLFRSGIVLSTGQVNPEYSGELTFGMYNASNFDFEFELGARIAHILYSEVYGTTNPYRGQWQNGRISAPVLEEQV